MKFKSPVRKKTTILNPFAFALAVHKKLIAFLVMDIFYSN